MGLTVNASLKHIVHICDCAATDITTEAGRMETPSFDRLSTRPFNGVVTSPAEGIVELMIMAFAVGQILKYIEGIVREWSMAGLMDSQQGELFTERSARFDVYTYMAAKAVEMPLAVQLAVHGRNSFPFYGSAASSTGRQMQRLVISSTIHVTLVLLVPGAFI